MLQNLQEIEKYKDYADKIAYKLLNDAYTDSEGNRWYDAWTRVKPWDVDAHLGLFVGAAGNASALLSYYSDKTGKKITPVFEYRKE